MTSKQFQSQTMAILANLQQKISKYLAPSYETYEIFDKSKALKKEHQKTILTNKQFIKYNEKQAYQRNQEQSNQSEFDKLMYRRKKCEAKLQKMLFDHQIMEPFQGGFMTSKIQQNKLSFRPYDDDFMSFSTLKQVKSQILLPSKKQPNFSSIEKELHNMQKKLQNLQKKIDQSKQKKHKDEMSIKKTKVKLNSKKSQSTEKPIKLNSQQSLGFSMDKISSKKHQYSFKKSPSLKNFRNSQSFLNRQNSQEIINRHKNHKCQQRIDQTSLNKKLPNNKKKTQPKEELKESKLKKVGYSKFQQQSKKNLQKVKNIKQSQLKQDFKNVYKSQNRIKLNLLKTESQQVL